jgi:hypothetical protein
MGMTEMDKAIDAHAFRLYWEFIREPDEGKALYRWTQKASAKVKRDFRAEAITDLNQENV